MVEGKVDFLLERMYEHAFQVQALKPPYVYGGRDPGMGLDCSGLGMILLGRAGYKSDAGTDWNSAALRTNVFPLNAPDKRLGARADELKAHFLWDDDTDVVHVGFMCTPSQVVHAIDTSRDILMWYGLEEASIRATAFMAAIDAEMWNDNGSPNHQGLLVKLMSDAWDVLTDTYHADVIAEVTNVLTAWDAYKDDTVISPDEAHTYAKAFRSRKMARDGVKPEGAVTNADNYLYDISVLHDQLGIEGVREEIVSRIFTLDSDSVIRGGCISMTSEAKFVAFYNARTDLSVETRFMSYEVVHNHFRVPSRYSQTFGQGASNHS